MNPEPMEAIESVVVEDTFAEDAMVDLREHHVRLLFWADHGPAGIRDRRVVAKLVLTRAGYSNLLKTLSREVVMREVSGIAQ